MCLQRRIVKVANVPQMPPSATIKTCWHATINGEWRSLRSGVGASSIRFVDAYWQLCLQRSELHHSRRATKWHMVSGWPRLTLGPSWPVVLFADSAQFVEGRNALGGRERQQRMLSNAQCHSGLKAIQSTTNRNIRPSEVSIKNLRMTTKVASGME